MAHSEDAATNILGFSSWILPHLQPGERHQLLQYICIERQRIRDNKDLYLEDDQISQFQWKNLKDSAGGNRNTANPSLYAKRDRLNEVMGKQDERARLCTFREARTTMKHLDQVEAEAQAPSLQAHEQMLLRSMNKTEAIRTLDEILHPESVEVSTLGSFDGGTSSVSIEATCAYLMSKNHVSRVQHEENEAASIIFKFSRGNQGASLVATWGSSESQQELWIDLGRLKSLLFFPSWGDSRECSWSIDNAVTMLDGKEARTSIVNMLLVYESGREHQGGRRSLIMAKFPLSALGKKKTTYEYTKWRKLLGIHPLIIKCFQRTFDKKENRQERNTLVKLINLMNRDKGLLNTAGSTTNFALQGIQVHKTGENTKISPEKKRIRLQVKPN